MFNNKKIKELQSIIDRNKEELDWCYEETDNLKKGLKEKTKELSEIKSTIAQASTTLQSCLETIRLQQDLLAFMYKGEIAENPSIEFAGVKTLRGGWELLNLRGKDISVNKSDDITIWASHDEAVRVDVENT